MRLNADYPGFQRFSSRTSSPTATARSCVLGSTGTGRDGEEQVFAVASFATTDDGLHHAARRGVGRRRPARSRGHSASSLTLCCPTPPSACASAPWSMADLDDMTAVLSAFDPVRIDGPARTRDDAVRWIEWQERNYAAYDFGLWVVETHEGRLRR